MWIFYDWCHKWSSFGVILAHVAWPKAQPLGQSVSLKFSLETRLESESFEPWFDLLAFLVQKLWSKINKLINYLISQIFLLEPETPASHPKYQKTQDCYLVSSKNFTEILPPNGWCPGPEKVGQSGPKVLHLWHHSQKAASPRQKSFFECRLEDLPCLLRLLPGLQSILDRRNSRTKPRAFRRFFSENPQKQSHAKELSWHNTSQALGSILMLSAAGHSYELVTYKISFKFNITQYCYNYKYHMNFRNLYPCLVISFICKKCIDFDPYAKPATDMQLLR